jgi:ABC-type Fe3+-hydroxamate transport system substrate-binding protein
MIDRIKTVQSSVRDAPRPRVYYSMGTPLFAINAGRFEVCLAETGGGEVVNRQIARKGKPGVNLSVDEFTSLNPSIIFISGFLSAPPKDYLRTCRELNLTAEAMTCGAVYALPPGWDFGSPRFVLGLMAIANILHPDRCSFDLDAETSQFYRRFYGRDPETARPNRSFCMPKSPAGSCLPANHIGGPGGTELV